MAQITDLKELLKHEILDLYSAEEQIIDALPKMVDKANNAQLKKALNDHLKVTEEQKTRLDEIKGLMSEKQDKDSPEKKGFFSKLFGGSGSEKCKGTEGLIKEAEKMMGEDMTREVLDAAIIGAAQKIEHYEISGYGTAVAYARELGLSNVAGLLQQTLDEEYAADDSLTKLAVGKVNAGAETAAASSSTGSLQKGKDSKGVLSSKSSLSKSANQKRKTTESAAKSNTSKGNSSKAVSSKSPKAPGNISAGKSVSKVASQSGGKSLSTNKSKSGKNKSSKKR